MCRLQPPNHPTTHPVSSRWMPRLELRLSREELRRLPRCPAYKYTWHDGTAYIHPRPRYYHAWLALTGLALEGRATASLRHLTEADWDACAEAFAEAFTSQQPFAGLSASERL